VRRRREKFNDSTYDDEGRLFTPAFTTPDYHEHDDLQQALARLRPPQRELICTYYGIGRPRVKPGKLLQQLGIAKSTLSLRRRLALRALRKMLVRSA
jgi:DNA-directed RNA polymerase specialized sigma24 family protein